MSEERFDLLTFYRDELQQLTEIIEHHECKPEYRSRIREWRKRSGNLEKRIAELEAESESDGE